MKKHSAAVLGTLAASLLVPGCATQILAEAPAVPEVLRPPQGQVLMMAVPASGVQIYECAATKTDATRFEWAFRGPDAVLLDRAGRGLGKHYGGPTWESFDGSKVVGEVKARDRASDAGAIPLLLLSAKSTGGEGSFSKVRSILRLETVGGIAPSEPCTQARVAQVARVPYTATYYLYADQHLADKR